MVLASDDVWIVDGVAVKRHGGPAGVARATLAAAAMRAARDAGLPVPAVTSVERGVLRSDVVVDAVGGIVALHEHPAAVLRSIGATARRLHDRPPPAQVPVACPDGVWVHGDLCPINVMVHVGDAVEVVAVLDWEDTRVDDPLVDLVWTEWLLRTFHGSAVPHLPSLYEGYGRPAPPPARRREVMARLLRRQVPREGEGHAATWRMRLDGLRRLDLDDLG